MLEALVLLAGENPRALEVDQAEVHGVPEHVQLLPRVPAHVPPGAQVVPQEPVGVLAVELLKAHHVACVSETVHALLQLSAEPGLKRAIQQSSSPASTL